MTIINLTQHAASAQQIEAGVVDLPAERLAKLKLFLDVPAEVLTASSGLFEEAIDSRARSIFCLLTPELANGARKVAQAVLAADSDISAWNATKEPVISVMVGGQPDLVEALVKLLRSHGVEVLRALTPRISVEVTNPDGSVTKTATFQHVGFSRARP